MPYLQEVFQVKGRLKPSCKPEPFYWHSEACSMSCPINADCCVHAGYYLIPAMPYIIGFLILNVAALIYLKFYFDKLDKKAGVKK